MTPKKQTKPKHIMSRLDRLRSEYGKALTNYEKAKKDAAVGKCGTGAMTTRLQEFETARARLSQAEEEAQKGWTPSVQDGE